MEGPVDGHTPMHMRAGLRVINNSEKKTMALEGGVGARGSWMNITIGGYDQYMLNRCMDLSKNEDTIQRTLCSICLTIHGKVLYVPKLSVLSPLLHRFLATAMALEQY